MKELQLQSDRIKLRPVVKADAEAVHILHSIPAVDQYNTLGIPTTFEKTLHIINELIKDYNANPVRQYTMVIEPLDDDDFIGLIAIRLGKEKYRNGEVWFKLDPQYWGKGFATEALRLLIDFGFSKLNLHRIEAGCAVDNRASVKVLEKSGMLREGHRRKALPLKSGWSDNYEYAIVETDLRPLGPRH